MIAYFKGKSFISKLIKWRTWSKYSHVAWIVNRDFKYTDAALGRIEVKAGTIYESWHRKSRGAERNGVRKGIAGDLHKPGTPIDLTAVQLSDEQYARLLFELEFHVLTPDAKYDTRAVISGFLLRKKSAASQTMQFCSELLMRGFNKVPGFRFLREILPEQTAPADMSHSPLQVEVGEWKTGDAWKKVNLGDDLR